MKVLLSGASGLVGKALAAALPASGHSVIPLVRGRGWMPESGDLRLREAPDAMVHLAGENLGTKRWSQRQKERIRNSRVDATARLAVSLAKLQPRPSIFISASAVGYYGNRGDELLTESSRPGTDFLAEVCTAWERAAEPLKNPGIRVVHLRFGMILDANGGALARMLPLFKSGLGGKLGSGQQWISWVTLHDVARVVQWALENDHARGAYNTTSPNPARNSEFTRALARALYRPAILSVPSPALRLAFGEMAGALLLASQRAVPARLTEEGFQFESAELAGAFARNLG
jgi:uncharacterized protein (TIGR01777 family)